MWFFSVCLNSLSNKETRTIIIQVLQKSNSKIILALLLALSLLLPTFITNVNEAAAGDQEFKFQVDRSMNVFYASMSYDTGSFGGISNPVINFEKRNNFFIYNKVSTTEGWGAYYFYNNQTGTYRATGSYDDTSAFFKVRFVSKSIEV